MSHFSIDDVRDTFTADITGLIARVQTASDELATAPLVAAGLGPALPSLFQQIADASHTIHGTAGLVGAESLRETARLLEGFAGRGKEALRQVSEALARVERAAAICAKGAEELTGMLALELESKGPEALVVARAFAQSAETARHDKGVLWDEQDRPPSMAPLTDPGAAKARGGASGAAIAVSEAPGAEGAAPRMEGAPSKERPTAPPPPPDPEAEAELAEVFREEARELVSVLETKLVALHRDPDDGAALADAERTFHTLKGAAAAVGMEAPRKIAADLQRRAEMLIDSGGPVSAGVVEGLVADVNRLLRAAGLGAMRGPSMAPMPTSAVETPRAREAADAMAAELRETFLGEVRESVVALAGHLAALAKAPSNKRPLEHAERIFHTLKGASASVGHAQVSSKAADLRARAQEAAEAPGPVAPAALERLVRETADLVREIGLDDLAHAVLGAVPAQAAVASARPDSDGSGVFRREARQIVQRARGLAEQVPAAPRRKGDLFVELGRLFHRLKGSAILSGDEAVAQEAASLQLVCESGTAPIELVTAGIDRIDQALGEARASELDASGSFGEGVKQGSAGAEGASAGASGTGGAGRAARESVSLVMEPEMWGAFEEECAELLDGINKAVLELEHSDRPKRVLENLTRLIHTLKGAVQTIGLTPTGRDLHRVEDLLEELLRVPILPPLRGVATFLLQVQASVKKNLRQATSGYVEASGDRLDAMIEAVLAGGRMPVEAQASGSAAGLSAGHTGSVAESVHEGGTGAGERRFIRVATERLDALMDLAGELVVNRSRLWSRVQTLRALQQDLGRSRRRLLDTVERFRGENEFSLLGRGGVGGVAGVGLGASGALGAGVGRAGVGAGASLLVGAALAQALAAGAPQPAPAEDPAWSGFTDLELDRYDEVNILARSLAEITDDVDEANAQLFRELSSFAEDSDVFGGIIGRIQGEVTRARMVPLDVLFTRLRLPARDAAERDGKDVIVETFGEDVNLDKTIADALFSPMLHLVRNAVGHGIEAPATRAARGKRPQGMLTLDAREQSGQIVIRVRDDGGGLDLAALRARGVEMRLLPPGTSEDDPRVKDMVFAPGLTTRATAGAVAGRGVGGDVVRRAIERLNGHVLVDTAAGKGTTFTITLPLTLAITKALLVRHGPRTFAFPLHFSERIIGREDATIIESAGVRRIKLEDGYLPIRTVDAVFGRPDRDLPAGPIVVLRVGQQRVCLQVEAVVGQEEIVVKNLGDLLGGHRLFAGVTIRGSGELVLIFDVPAMVDADAGERRDGGAPASSRSGSALVAEVTRAADASRAGDASRGAGDSTVSRAMPPPAEAKGDGGEAAAARGAGAVRAAPSTVGEPEQRAPSVTRGAAPAPDETAPRAPAAQAPAARPSAPGARGRDDNSTSITREMPAVTAQMVAAAMGARPPVVKSAKVRVMFVDDSLSVRKIAERTLQQLGVEVILAVDGADALSKLRQGAVDVLFTDLEMPRMHGYDLIRELRFIPTYKDLPIIVVSSRSAQKHVEQAKVLGASDYMTKPFDAQSLGAALSKHAGQKWRGPGAGGAA